MRGIIERRREVDDVMKFWNELCGGKARTTVCEFYGIPGIGKTELAKQIESALRSAGALCAHINFGHARDLSAEDLFKELFTSWDCLHSLNLQEAPLESAGESALKPQHLAQQVIERVKNLPVDKTVALICDETDRIQKERFSWFEERLFAPLAMSGHCLIIWLGREQRQWPVELDFIKIKIESLPVEPFELSCLGELSDEEVELRGDLLHQMFSLTQGHALALTVVKQHYTRTLSKDKALDNNPEIIHAITEQVIRGCILQGDSLQYSDALKLSLLRIQDQHLLGVLADDPSEIFTSPYTLNNVLRASRLSEGPYFDPIRPVNENPASLPRSARERYLKEWVSLWLQHHYRISDPQGYERKQNALLQECSRQCNSEQELAWPNYAQEGIYHAACANDVTAGKYHLPGILREYLENLQSLDMKETLPRQLRERLLHDKDIQDYIGVDGIDELIAILDQAVSGL